MKKLLNRLVIFLFVYQLSSCNSSYTPKPRGYFRISFPPHQYQLFNKPDYPYSFEYPVYAEVIKDSSFFGDRPTDPYWINIDIPRFKARIYCSYKTVAGNFERLREDAYKMTFKHTYKATSIEDSVMQTPMGIHGIFFSIGGNTATAKRFFVSDSVKNFLTGALYFDSAPNEDSLGIVNDFLVEDMRHLINTFRWKN
jgi:gliding motility-associated lipoprotein GldD